MALMKLEDIVHRQDAMAKEFCDVFLSKKNTIIMKENLGETALGFF